MFRTLGLLANFHDGISDGHLAEPTGIFIRGFDQAAVTCIFKKKRKLHEHYVEHQVDIPNDMSISAGNR